MPDGKLTEYWIRVLSEFLFIFAFWVIYDWRKGKRINYALLAFVCLSIAMLAALIPG